MDDSRPARGFFCLLRSEGQQDQSENDKRRSKHISLYFVHCEALTKSNPPSARLEMAGNIDDKTDRHADQEAG